MIIIKEIWFWICDSDGDKTHGLPMKSSSYFHAKEEAQKNAWETIVGAPMPVDTEWADYDGRFIPLAPELDRAAVPQFAVVNLRQEIEIPDLMLSIRPA